MSSETVETLPGITEVQFIIQLLSSSATAFHPVVESFNWSRHTFYVNHKSVITSNNRRLKHRFYAQHLRLIFPENRYLIVRNGRWLHEHFVVQLDLQSITLLAP
ncbi:hypothetical protein CDAR_423961 [Caerostris darwini]|uniref:Uncharacterized protein n=1 Tax=Caerostris darwini TaxID=1538125 RepID=A0AAV4VF22_9ARAC|nr:hypothetical protein CDAR_423961 [Caerostris darwini]